MVALVGYTNAGKSTLSNRLTGADVFVADRFFATLDPTARKFRLPGAVRAILVDTVGFIHDLPAEAAPGVPRDPRGDRGGGPSPSTSPTETRDDGEQRRGGERDPRGIVVSREADRPSDEQARPLPPGTPPQEGALWISAKSGRGSRSY